MMHDYDQYHSEKLLKNIQVIYNKTNFLKIQWVCLLTLIFCFFKAKADLVNPHPPYAEEIRTTSSSQKKNTADKSDEDIDPEQFAWILQLEDIL